MEIGKTRNTGVTSVSYDGATQRPLSVAQPSGITTVLAYTAVSDGNRLQSVMHTNANGLILSFGYVYDVLGHIMQITETRTIATNVWSYQYDLAGQLVAATQRDAVGIVLHRYVYAYDKAGNRVTEQIDAAVATEAPNVNNQLTSRAGGGTVRVAGFISETGAVAIAGSPARMVTTTNFVGEVSATVGTNSFPVVASDPTGNTTTNWYQLTVSANGMDTTFNYDLAGNQLTKSNSAGMLAFGWDGADRCTAITNGALRTAIAYDGLSRWARITEYSNATVIADRRFIWNGLSLAEERDATGTNVVQRFFGNGFQRSGTNYFYVKDHLGSVREVYNASGVLQARFDYDPYGRRTQTYGTLWVDYGFAGLMHHKGSGICFAVFRLYQSDVARWASRDPIREEGGLNLYAYCEGDPLDLADPLGFGPTVTPDENLFDGWFRRIWTATFQLPTGVPPAAHTSIGHGKHEPTSSNPAAILLGDESHWFTPEDYAKYLSTRPSFKRKKPSEFFLGFCNAALPADNGKVAAQEFGKTMLQHITWTNSITIYAYTNRIRWDKSADIIVDNNGSLQTIIMKR